MSSQGREGAIDLLGEHDTSQLVRIRHGRKREHEVCPIAPAGWQSIGATNHEHHIPGFSLSPLYHGNESGRIESLAGRIETHAPDSPPPLHWRVDPWACRSSRDGSSLGRNRNVLGVSPKALQVIIRAG